jgi:hypothetical protein
MQTLFKPTVDFLVYHQTSQYIPEEGHAIVWVSPNGSYIEGCVTYEVKRRCIGVNRKINWLPLVDSKGHQADTPIKYLPSLWRYK